MKNSIYIILYFVLFLVHFGFWHFYIKSSESVFIKYYLFLTLIFLMVITMITFIRKIYPNYVGFVFLGLVLFKLTLMLLIMNKLNFKNIPDYKFHFIIPYLVSLVLETLYSVDILKKDEKNH